MKNYSDDYANKMIDKTYQYSKKYNLKITPNTRGWNDEADAFRHTFIEASMSLKTSLGLSKIAGDIHEDEGKKKGQDSKEENMDKWNNNQGREIANEIAAGTNPVKLKILAYSGQLDDVIAEKVYERMKAGKLITNPNDSRNYEKTYGKNSQFSQNNRVYTFEELKRMPYEEVRRNQRKILEAFTSGRMIYESKAKEKVKSGELIYVESYTRHDGTKVSGYYRRK